MTLKQFEKFIDAIQIYHVREEEFSKALEPFNSSYTIIEFCPLIVNTIIEFIEETFNDKGEWFTYWLYELNFGTNLALMNGCSNEDGSKIDISTVEKLYSFLLENKEKNE